MKCKKCKMDIPKGAKICPYCNSKQGMSVGETIAALILIGIVLSFVASIGRTSREVDSRSGSATTSVASEDPYSSLKDLISPACRSVGISPSEIKVVTQLDNWEGGERYQFSFNGCNYTADLNEDGTLNKISLGTNALYADGEVKIRYMNGFLVRDDGGTTQYESCEVNGIVMNITGKDCAYVQVDIGYYSDSGTKIASGLDNVLNLKNGEQWRFKAYGIGSGIAKYKIEDISWY